MMLIKKQLSYIFSSILILFLFSSIHAGEQGDNNSTNNVVNSSTDHPDLSWSYDGHNGPNMWGSFDGDHICGSGISQSPISIETGKAAGLSNVSIDPALQSIPVQWKPSQLSILNNGHTLQVVYDPGSTITWEGHTYTLQQFHFHSPSEHIVNEKEYPMEVHFVSTAQQSEGLKVLVVAVMLKAGSHSPILGHTLDHAPSTVDTTPITISGSPIDATLLLPHDMNYFAYTGSLTTPPCTEGIQWIIMKKPMEVAVEQVHQFQSLFHGPNNRPIQPLNERKVERSLF
jgi:carbonic anhydrase